MKTAIIEHLEELADKENIKILMAIESGSRAWGCPSPDSDYDVRIVYVHPLDSYLSIESPPDNIDYFHGELLDINGWDFRKTLRLMQRSNATPFEWAQSPMVYFEVEGFRNHLMDLAHLFFQPRHALNHYKGIAKNSYFSNELSGEIKLKKLFYVLRPLMAASWIVEKQTIPPMDIPALLSIVKETEIVEHIKELLTIKKSANEDYVHNMDSLIVNYIEKTFVFIDQANFAAPDAIPNVDQLNIAFRAVINSYK